LKLGDGIGDFGGIEPGGQAARDLDQRLRSVAQFLQDGFGTIVERKHRCAWDQVEITATRRFERMKLTEAKGHWAPTVGLNRM